VSVDGTGTSRLFVAAGKKDRVTPKSLVTMIKKLSDLSDAMIGSVEVYEAFSFVSVPYKSAEKIIDQARRAGGFPVVRRAVPKGPAGTERRPDEGFVRSGPPRTRSGFEHRGSKEAWAGRRKPGPGTDRASRKPRP
jgi:hypothetical protein